jgi:hypothetical protein
MSDDVSIHVGQSFFDFRVEMFQDLNNGVGVIYFKKHDGTVGSWDAVVDNTQLVYVVQDGDIDQNGWWEFQGIVTMPDGRKIIGEKFIQEIKPSLI